MSDAMKHIAYAGLASLLLVPLGCKEKKSGGSVTAPEPTNLPTECVTSSTRSIKGNKSTGSSVWQGTLADASDASEVVPEDYQTTFSFSLKLADGDNTFYLQARKGNKQSNVAGPYTVCRDSEAPNPPTIDATPTDPITGSSITLSGGKDADAGICRVNDEECDVIVAVDAATTWQATIALSEGANDICIRAVDAAGNESEGDVCVVVTMSQCLTIDLTSPGQGAIVGPGLDGAADSLTSEALDVIAQVTADQEIESVEACVSGVCTDAGAAGDIWTASNVAVTASANLERVTLEIKVKAGDCAVSGLFDLTFVNQMAVIAATGIDRPSERPRMLVDDEGRVHLVWEDSCGGDSACTIERGQTPPDIFYRMWDRKGWSGMRGLSTRATDGRNELPRLAIDDANLLHVVWKEPEGLDDTLFERTLNLELLTSAADVDSNASWASALGDYVNIGSGEITRVRALDLVADGVGDLHLVYEQEVSLDNGTDRHVYYRRYDGSWGSATLVSPATPDGQTGTAPISEEPAVAADLLGVAHIAWREDGAISYRAIDSDDELSDILALTDTTGSPSKPAVAVPASASAAHVVWTGKGDGDDNDIWFQAVTVGDGLLVSADGDAMRVWSGDADGSATSNSVSIVEAGDCPYVFWSEASAEVGGTEADQQIVMARCDGGADIGFEDPQLISRGETTGQGGVSSGARAMVDATGSVHVTWYGYSALGTVDQNQIWYFAFRE